MRGLLVRWVISGLSLLAVGYLVPGFRVEGFFHALVAAAVLGVLNAVVRPVLVILTLPLTVFTLGLFLFVINALMLWLISGLLKGIHIESFWSALLGAIILSGIGWLVNTAIQDDRGSGRIDLRHGPDGRWS